MCFTLSTTCAGVVALAVALALHLAHPFWAPMAVWLVAQPTRGLLLERAAARVAGTLAGSLVGLGLQMALGDHTGLLLGAMLVWVALCIAGAQLFRFFRSYALLLAGYTACVLILAGLAEPVHRDALSMMRIECTLIGVAASLLLGSLCARSSDRPSLSAALAAFTATAQIMTADESIAPVPQERFDQLLIEAARIEVMSDEVAAGSRDWSMRAQWARHALSTSIGMIAQARARRIHGDTTPDEAGTRSFPMLDAVDAIGSAKSPTTLAARLLARVDRTAALRAASRAVLCLGGLIAIWLVTGWHYGGAMVMSAAIFTVLFSAHGNPVAATRTVLAGSILGALAALLYRNVAVLHGNTILQVLLGVTPFLVMGAYVMAQPRTNKAAIDYIMTFLLVGQPAVSTGETSIVASAQQAAAILAGVGAAVLVYRALMPARPIDLMRVLDQSMTRACRAAEASKTDAQARKHGHRAILRAISMGQIAGKYGVALPVELLNRLASAAPAALPIPSASIAPGGADRAAFCSDIPLHADRHDIGRADLPILS